MLSRCQRIMLLLGLCLGAVAAEAFAALTSGRLIVHPANPRYFMVEGDPDQKAVLMVGSHVWNNFQDWRQGAWPTNATRLDFNDLLDYLTIDNDFNFMRGWAWETTILAQVDMRFDPPIWQRQSGTGNDGRPKVNLDLLNLSYINRVDSRVGDALQRGVSMSVMFFEPITYGDRQQNCVLVGGNLAEEDFDWYTHGFQRDNNVNGIDGDPNNDCEGWETSTYPPVDSDLFDQQRHYLRQVVDELHHLPVIWEVGNEGWVGNAAPWEGFEWQEQIMAEIRSWETTQGYDPHPVWMSAMVQPGRNHLVNGLLLSTDAEVLSPNGRSAPGVSGDFNGQNGGPPPNNFRYPGSAALGRIIILDTDHICGGCQGGGNPPPIITDPRGWSWKAFTRGYHFAFMDSHFEDNPWGLIELPHHLALRDSMSHIKGWSEQIGLAAMAPRGNLSSTNFALADPGDEYLAYKPANQAVVSLSAVQSGVVYDYQWFRVTDGATSTGTVTPAGTTVTLSSPWSSTPAALHLEVSLAPVITMQPQDVLAPYGGLGWFEVRATGEGTLAYQWQQEVKGGLPVNLVDGNGTFSGTTTTFLQVHNVQEQDFGRYRCVVTSEFGTTWSNWATLANWCEGVTQCDEF